MAEAGDVARSVGVRLAVVALVSLVAALVRGWTPLLPLSLALLGAIYATHLRVDDVALDLRAPAIAAALLVTAELGYWSLEECERIQGERGESLRRLAIIAALAVAAVLLGAAVLALANLTRAHGLAVDLLGAAAAIGAFALLALVARPARRSRDGAA